MTEKRFLVKVVGTASMKISEIWPEGDAPEDPTEDDVLEALEEYGDLSTVLVDWNLEKDFEFNVRTEQPGVDE